MNVERVIATLDELLRQDPSTSVFLPGEERFSGVPEAERRAARDRIRGTIVEQVLPGVRRYREFLAGELLQKARNAADCRPVWNHCGSGRIRIPGAREPRITTAAPRLERQSWPGGAN